MHGQVQTEAEQPGLARGDAGGRLGGVERGSVQIRVVQAALRRVLALTGFEPAALLTQPSCGDRGWYRLDVQRPVTTRTAKARYRMISNGLLSWLYSWWAILGSNQ